MPQEFQVLQCYSCETFQVHQVKKALKWNCKLCGEKQSIKKVIKSVGQQFQSKGAKIRNQYNQVPHLTQDTNGKVTNSQLDTTNESQEVSPFPAGDHKAHINRHAKEIANTRQKKHERSTKEVPPWNGQ